ncbi:MAG: bifunctional oligoribonuclease/PAP phosphatase NrnA [Clostridiales bacterium]|nr:bifunctional oligoribonuclease/PAP phosphatase NrnA [Clostridiales bacterium]
MNINIKECAQILKKKNNIFILTHAHPDGDTLGSGFALCRALMKLGKKARVINDDEIPKKYNYLYDDLKFEDFKEEFIIAVDVATENLLGALQDEYRGKTDICVDHHLTNTDYAVKTLLCDVPATCEIIYKLILELGAEIDKKTADCLYTGLSTDTGCFRYASTTSQSYRIAADLIDLGADNGFINRAMFETKTKSYVMLERLALNGLKLYCGDKIAVIKVTQDMYRKTGSNEQETEALAPLTRQIEGVQIGITMREKKDKTCKASIRTFEVNAAQLAKCFGGGGHSQAAACRFDCTIDEAEKLIVEKCGEFLL